MRTDAIDHNMQPPHEGAHNAAERPLPTPRDTVDELAPAAARIAAPPIRPPTEAALARPAGQRVRQSPPAAEIGYKAEVDLQRTALLHARTRAPHIAASAHVGFWTGLVVGAPAAIVEVGGRFFLRAMDYAWNENLQRLQSGGVSAVVAALLLPFILLGLALASIIFGLGRLVARPFKVLHRALEGLDGEGRAVDPGSPDATHVRLRPTDLPDLASNAAAIARLKSAPSKTPYDAIIVTGCATDDQMGPLHALAEARLRQAARDLEAGRAPCIVLTGGNVHPPGTPYNEAFEMRRYLMDVLGVPADRILVEPLAQHTTTNLRNAGRLMTALGLERGLVVGTPGPIDQTFYLQTADSPFYGVTARSMAELGGRMGELERVDATHTLYVPSRNVWLSPLAERDDP